MLCFDGTGIKEVGATSMFPSSFPEIQKRKRKRTFKKLKRDKNSSRSQALYVVFKSGPEQPAKERKVRTWVSLFSKNTQ